MGKSEGERAGTPLGARLLEALAAEGKTQTAAETAMVELGILSSRGALSSLITGRRAKKGMNLETLGAIADFLHVELDWLTRGRGPMRAGASDLTPLQDAAALMRRDRVHERAIQAATEKHGYEEEGMTRADWVSAIVVERNKLEREGAIPPQERSPVPGAPPGPSKRHRPSRNFSTTGGYRDCGYDADDDGNDDDNGAQEAQ